MKIISINQSSNMPSMNMESGRDGHIITQCSHHPDITVASNLKSTVKCRYNYKMMHLEDIWSLFSI